MLIPISGLFLVSFFFSQTVFFLKKGRGPTSKKIIGYFCQLIKPEKKPDLHTSFSEKRKKKKIPWKKKTTAFDPGKKKTKLFDIKKDDELGMQEDYLENLENRKPSVINYVYFKIFRKINL